ncbi:hypothetical protein FGB62_247g02 [Gracilaria domingensis]|nr:hypothetical protein FGB62_247g02 [Gracilaria domingensis]
MWGWDSELNRAEYNFRFSEKREILISNENGSVSVWPEAEEPFSYNDTVFLSFLSFEISSGFCKDSSLAIVVLYRSESLYTVTLENRNPFSTDVGTPPMLLGLVPNFTESQGDTKILLNGVFDGLRDSNIVRVGRVAILGSDVENLENGSLAFLAPPL